jgi:hypothetical protein
MIIYKICFRNALQILIIPSSLSLKIVENMSVVQMGVTELQLGQRGEKIALRALTVIVLCYHISHIYLYIQ